MSQIDATTDLFSSIAFNHPPSEYLSTPEQKDLFEQSLRLIERHQPLFMMGQELHRSEESFLATTEVMAHEAIRQSLPFPGEWELAVRVLEVMGTQEQTEANAKQSIPLSRCLLKKVQEITNITMMPESIALVGIQRLLDLYSPQSQQDKVQHILLRDFVSAIQSWHRAFLAFSQDPSQVLRCLEQARRSTQSPESPNDENPNTPVMTQELSFALHLLGGNTDSWGRYRSRDELHSLLRRVGPPEFLRFDAFLRVIYDRSSCKVGTPELWTHFVDCSKSPHSAELLEGIVDALEWRAENRTPPEGLWHQALSDTIDENLPFILEQCFDLPSSLSVRQLALHNEEIPYPQKATQTEVLLSAAVGIGEALFQHSRFRGLLPQGPPVPEAFSFCTPAPEERLSEANGSFLSELLGYTQMVVLCPELVPSPEEFFVRSVLHEATQPNASPFLEEGQDPQKLPISVLENQLTREFASRTLTPVEVAQRFQRVDPPARLAPDRWARFTQRFRAYLLHVLYEHCDFTRLAQALAHVDTEEDWEKVENERRAPLRRFLEVLCCPLDGLVRQVYMGEIPTYHGDESQLFATLSCQVPRRFRQALDETEWWEDWTDEELQEMVDSHLDTFHLNGYWGDYRWDEGQLAPQRLAYGLLRRLSVEQMQRLTHRQALTLLRKRSSEPSIEVFPGWSQEHAEECIRKLEAVESLCQSSWSTRSDDTAPKAMETLNLCAEHNEDARAWVHWLQQTPELWKEWAFTCPVKRLMFFSLEENVSCYPTQTAFDNSDLPGILEGTAQHLAPLRWLYRDGAYFRLDPCLVVLELAKHHGWAMAYLQGLLSGPLEELPYLAEPILTGYWEGQTGWEPLLKDLREHPSFGPTCLDIEDKILRLFLEDQECKSFPQWWSPLHTQRLGEALGRWKQDFHLSHQAKEFFKVCVARWANQPADLRQWLTVEPAWTFSLLSPKQISNAVPDDEAFEELFPQCRPTIAQQDALTPLLEREHVELAGQPPPQEEVQKTFHPSEVLLSLADDDVLWARETLSELLPQEPQAITYRVWSTLSGEHAKPWHSDLLDAILCRDTELEESRLVHLYLDCELENYDGTRGFAWKERIEQRISKLALVRAWLWVFCMGGKQKHLWLKITEKLEQLAPSPLVFHQAFEQLPLFSVRLESQILQEWLLEQLEQDRTFEKRERDEIKSFPWLMRSAIHQLALGLQNPLTQSLRGVLESVIRETRSVGGNQRREPMVVILISALIELLRPSDWWEVDELHPFTMQERALLYLILGVSNTSKAMRQLKTQRKYAQHPELKKACSRVLKHWNRFSDDSLPPRRRMEKMVLLLFFLHRVRRGEQPREREKQALTECVAVLQTSNE
jgi:hypothetical protein